MTKQYNNLLNNNFSYYFFDYFDLSFGLLKKYSVSYNIYTY